MEEKDKLYLMLEEYRALRVEEIERTRLEYQLYGLAVAIGMALAIAGTFAHRPGLFLGFALLTAILLGCPMVLMQHEINVVAKRLRELEYQINTRTKDRLFARESDHAVARELGGPRGSAAALGRAVDRQPCVCGALAQWPTPIS